MAEQKNTIRVAEMFAGVGGFRLGLEGYSDPARPDLAMPAAGPFETVWANQWEPPGRPARQFAWRCYEQRFGAGSCINEDISAVLDAAQAGGREIPDFDMLVGGFPCQDYSVAKPLHKARGIEGKKGVLWWDIRRMLEMKRPQYFLLENVDRLLTSPASQRGRDFAIILSCLNQLGYSAEWRVVNAADYGMPQRRRRVYIFGELRREKWDLESRAKSTGVLASAFPIASTSEDDMFLRVSDDPAGESAGFGVGLKASPWKNAGAMQAGFCFTCKAAPFYDGPRAVLADIALPDSEIPEEFFIDPADLPKWEYQRAAKRIPRTAANGREYVYSEGAMAFPDPLDRPARTILTGEGGKSASRMKHAIRAQDGRVRRLVPDELDQIQMFPKGWTDCGMTDGQRAFCMGNALVTGIPHRIGAELAHRIERGED